jgi:hypothetical protein
MKRPALRKLVLFAGVVAAVAGAMALRPEASETPAPSPATSDGGGTSTSEVRQDPSAVQKYWTPERMEKAEPAPMAEDG